jgi:CheY-like chemotaxis protein
MKTILMVAKDSTVRTALARRLEEEGYVIVTSKNPKEAIASLKGFVPGAILIDLPVEAARRFVKTIVARPETRMIPRLAVVAAWDHEAALPRSAALFLKPLDPDHLSRTLAALYPSASRAAPPLGEAPPRAALSVLDRDERIQEALELIASDPLPPVVAPPVSRAEVIAHSYVLELLQQEATPANETRAIALGA